MLRRQFAEKANQVGPWIERQMDAVTAIGMGLQVLRNFKADHFLSQISRMDVQFTSSPKYGAFQGSLEDQMHRLQEYEQAVYAYKPHIEELEKIHQAIQEGMIFENR